MYRTLNKIFKIAGNRAIFQGITKTGLKNYSRALTFTSKSNFSEKFERFGGGRNQTRQTGNLNLRQVFTGSENINKILEFIENNIQSMNDTDFLDAMTILSFKLGSDNSEVFARIIRTNKITEIFKNWVKENFDRVVESNCTNLTAIAFESSRHNLGLFDNPKKGKIAQLSLEFIERSINSGRGQTVFFFNFRILLFLIWL
jgi:hypothetical protein